MSDIRYTNLELRKAFRNNIIIPILANAGFSTIPVISDNQNAPAPIGTFISLPYSPTWQRVGRREVFYTEVSGTEEYEGEPRDTYNNLVKTNYTLTTFDIKEYNGEGDLLSLIIETIDTNTYREILNEIGIGLLQIGSITPIPELVNDLWIKSSVVELTLSVANAIEEDIQVIDSVIFEGTYE